MVNILDSSTINNAQQVLKDWRFMKYANKAKMVIAKNVTTVQGDISNLDDLRLGR